MSEVSVKALIVDDSDVVIERLYGIVSEMKFVSPVLISNTFQQAVELINLQQPNIVLFDLHLNGKSGIDLLSFIKSNYPSIKTLVVTNRVSDYYKELCKEKGADGFVDKSTEFEKIPFLIEDFFCFENSSSNILQ
ncbi:MAG TPA: response regulator [Ferruginibacter sp.]|nr:response regulator [Ferruginibacter sp.]HRE64644.1 response regulator [Ferruginibacter sp.]